MIQLTRMPGGTCTGVAVAQITAVPQDVQIHPHGPFGHDPAGPDRG